MIRRHHPARSVAVVVALTLAAVTAAGLGTGPAAAAPSAQPSPAQPIDTPHHSLSGLARNLPTGPRRGFGGVPRQGRYGFFLRLDARSTAMAFRASAGQGRAVQRDAARVQFSRIRQAQSRVVAALPGGSQVLYRTHSVLPGVAVFTDVRNAAALGRLPGVTAVLPIAPKSPSLSYAVPLMKAPQVWAGGERGQNSTIAIIDSGIDYTHADFGGPGTTAAYQAAKANSAHAPDPALFPSQKIIGGYDFSGDDYNADPTSDPTGSYPYNPVPSPDANPLDCDGHGTHVAGIAAGQGVTAGGQTYTGGYDTNTAFNSLRIGPGMAPAATLYAFKVFGCEGSTELITAAIDRAADPNNDGDPSDHVDVINMSIGSDFASPRDPDAMAVNAASVLGISVVVAAGNAGDVYDVGGSPSDAFRAITVASSQDAYSQWDALHVAAPGNIAGDKAATRASAYDWAAKRDLSGTVARLGQAGNRDGCHPLSSADAALVAGKIAFLEWAHDDAARRCGSAARADNVAAAGGAGYVLADDEEVFTSTILGNDRVPGVLVAKSGADAIRSELAAGHTVTISGTTANSFPQLVPANDDTVSDFSSRGLGEPGDVKPDVTAVGSSVFSAAVGTGSDGVSMSGTSMAAPMVAGLSALVRSSHPDWTPEQVKADIVNTADQDVFTGGNHTGARFAPNRVGAGRIDAQAALATPVLAYVADDPGAVSASFGSFAVTGPTTLTKTIKLVNTGLAAVTYGVAYDAITTMPGVAYSVAPSSVTIDHRSTATVTLTLNVRAGLLTKTIDPTVGRQQLGVPREYLADSSGRVLFTSAGNPELRVPVYAAPRPASRMTQPGSVTLPAGRFGAARLPLSGRLVDQGSGRSAIRSTVAGFELQVRSGLAPACGPRRPMFCVGLSDERSADVKYVGVTSNAPQLASAGRRPLGPAGLAYFAITGQGPWATAASQQEFDIAIDTTGDGVPDVVAFNTRLQDGAGSPTDVQVTEVIDLSSGQVIDIEPLDARFGDVDAALFNSDTLVMPVAVAALPGIRWGHSRISYGIESFSPYQDAPIDVVGFGPQMAGLDRSLTFDVLHPGIAVYGAYHGTGNPLLYRDASGTALQVHRDLFTYTQDRGLGAEIVHFHNLVGLKAQVVAVRSTKITSPVRLRPGRTTVRRGAWLTLTITVRGGAGVPPSGAVVVKRLSPAAGALRLAQLRNGSATVRVRFPAPGRKVVQVAYRGDANYTPARSPTQPIVVT